MKNRLYRFSGYTDYARGDFQYRSYGRKGSIQNYVDFRTAFILRFHRKPSWEFYNKQSHEICIDE